MNADPVSWLMIERGWKVLAADGTEIGHVHEVTGDSTHDIFNGLAVSTGLLRSARYVPAERVAEITEGCVRLDLAPQELEHLREHGDQPPHAQVRPE